MRLIDADVLTERLNNAIECGRRVDMPTLELEAVLANVQNAPSIELEPKRGEWIYGEHDVAMCDGYRCNRCDFFVPWDYEHKFIDFINDYHFCPNCGADMRKGADDE